MRKLEAVSCKCHYSFLGRRPRGPRIGRLSQAPHGLATLPPVRIAFLTHEPFYPPSGGGSAAAVYLVRELVTRGHQVSLFGPASAAPAEVESRFGLTFHPFTAWAMGRTTPLRTPKYLAYPSALARLVSRTIDQGTPFDLLLAQHSISAVAAGSLKRRYHTPIALNLLDCLTGFMETWPSWWMRRWIAPRLVDFELGIPSRSRADAVLTVSDGLRDRLITRGFPQDRLRAIYYGYDATLFRHQPNRTPATPPVVVMHGSFDHHHLGPIAHTAVLETARRQPLTRFRFVGPSTPALRAFLDRLRHLCPGIHLEHTGFVPYDRIPEALADASVGITPYQPSTGTHCAFVAKTVEYLALGLPVVSTPLDSAVRYFGSLPGVRFSSLDGTGFAEAILHWLQTSPSARESAVEPARRKVEAELDWSVICRRAAEFIEQRTPATAN